MYPNHQSIFMYQLYHISAFLSIYIVGVAALRIPSKCNDHPKLFDEYIIVGGDTIGIPPLLSAVKQGSNSLFLLFFLHFSYIKAHFSHQKITQEQKALTAEKL